MKKYLTVILLVCFALTTTVWASISYNPKADTSKIKFVDVTSKHWAKGTIYKLAAQKNKIFSGYPGGMFKPDANMTRAEFVTALVKTMGYTVTDEVYATYKDVPKTHWAYRYVGLAQEKGIIETTDYGDTFKPNEIISRFEACNMMINCFPRTKLVVNDNTVTMYPIFKDANKLDQKQKKVVHILYRKGILKGYPDGTAGLGMYATRAELATFILKFIENSSKLENYIVSKDDLKEVKPFYNTSGEYTTYRELLPEYTVTVKGRKVQNSGLKEKINSIEWFRYNSSYNGKYKAFIDKCYKNAKKCNDRYWLNGFNKGYIVALNVTISYSGAKDKYGVYDYQKLLRNANIYDDKNKYIDFITDLFCDDPDELSLGSLMTKKTTRTYTLFRFYERLPTHGTITLYGGRSMPDAEDDRRIVIIY